MPFTTCRSEAEWAALIVAQTSDAMIVTDRDGRIQVWNHGAERLFGHRADAMRGETLDVIIPESLRQAHWNGFAHAVRTGMMKYEGAVLTTRSMHQDGRKLYIEMSFNLLRDGSGEVVGVLAIARDGTTRYEQERAMRARLRALEGQQPSSH